MADLLEDPNGAPYPEPAQQLWREVREMHVELVRIGVDKDDLERIDMLCVDAFESVARSGLDD